MALVIEEVVCNHSNETWPQTAFIRTYCMVQFDLQYSGLS